MPRCSRVRLNPLAVCRVPYRQRKDVRASRGDTSTRQRVKPDPATARHTARPRLLDKYEGALAALCPVERRRDLGAMASLSACQETRDSGWYCYFVDGQYGA